MKYGSVGILHAKLPAPHHAETRTYLITKFSLDLIEIDWQLTIGFYLPTYQVSYYFFMSRPQGEGAVMAIIQAH